MVREATQRRRGPLWRLLLGLSSRRSVTKDSFSDGTRFHSGLNPELQVQPSESLVPTGSTKLLLLGLTNHVKSSLKRTQALLEQVVKTRTSRSWSLLKRVL